MPIQIIIISYANTNETSEVETFHNVNTEVQLYCWVDWTHFLGLCISIGDTFLHLSLNGGVNPQQTGVCAITTNFRVAEALFSCCSDFK